MGMERENGEEEAVLVMVPGKTVGGVEMVKQAAQSTQELASAVGDLVVDVANAVRGGGDQPVLERTQEALQVHAPRLKRVTHRIGADAVQWMHQGGFWRSVLVMSVSVL